MIKANAFHIAKMLSHLQRDGRTAYELMDLTGMDRDTVYRWLRELHIQRLIFVESWDQDARGRYVVARYRLGKQKDALRTYADPLKRAREWRARLKQVKMNQMLAGRLGT
jgi:DNA-binding IclR family transcriptional regulator